ncbi:MAG TPA: superoxide dismutase family protein [Opitutaceae bacterium]|nr:superoxide dismutase family protein [Opitutaceae bacterium]
MNTLHSLAPVLRLGGALAAAAFLVNVSPSADDHATHAGPAHAAPTITTAVAVLQPTQGNAVRGTVRFTKVDGGVRIVAEISGLTPGLHGFHVHEFGDASSPDGSAAGGHFNPAHAAHGGPTAAERHAGDFGNLEADASGHARLDRVDPALSLEGPHSIIGRGLIVHAAPDDLKTQPTGNAGGRVACGVIGIAKAP